MAYKEVKLESIDLKKYPNKPLEGYYLGVREFEGKFGTNYVHKFQKKTGEEVSIYGFTSLNNKLETITVGTLCQVTYTGTKNVKTKYGLKNIHDCTILADDTDRLEMSRVPVAAAVAGKLAEVEEDNNDLPF